MSPLRLLVRGIGAPVNPPSSVETVRADTEESLSHAVEILHGKTFVAVTGAGLSTDSGIPDYRGEGAPRNHPMSIQEFLSSEERRRRYWLGSHLGWVSFHSASPNLGHRALAHAEKLGLSTGVITQNVDGLHQDAGSLRVVDLHGRLDRVACLKCGQSYSRPEIARQIEQLNPWVERESLSGVVQPDGDVAVEVSERFVVPSCDLCGGMLKPQVVFFGEFVPPTVFQDAMALLSSADALVVAGSSLVVNTGVRFVNAAKKREMPIVVINRGPTRADSAATVRIEGGTSPTLQALVAALSSSEVH